MLTLYHNPRCSKSREALKLLRDHGIEPRVIEYLKTPPTRSELKQLLRLLGLRAHELVRRKEPEYEQAKLAHASEAQILRAMVEHPVLIERPIAVMENKAVLGRPPENVLKLL